MYSYEERLQAVKLYLKLGKRSSIYATLRGCFGLSWMS